MVLVTLEGCVCSIRSMNRRSSATKFYLHLLESWYSLKSSPSFFSHSMDTLICNLCLNWIVGCLFLSFTLQGWDPSDITSPRGDEDGDKTFPQLFMRMGHIFSWGARMGNSPLPSLLHELHSREKGRAKGHLYVLLAPQHVF